MIDHVNEKECHRFKIAGVKDEDAVALEDG